MPGNRTACPACGASMRPEATFCGQCYADFRPPPPPLEPAPAPGYAGSAPDPLTAPLLDVVLPPVAGHLAVPGPAAVQPLAPAAVAVTADAARWPCGRCTAVNPLTETACGVCGTPFLAKVSEDTRVTLVLPVVGDLGRYGRGQRAAIAVAAILVVLLPLALVTLLLTGRPPAEAPATGTPATASTGAPTPG